jgi:ABC-type Fe3+-citrate transport system substrate-binding protein
MRISVFAIFFMSVALHSCSKNAETSVSKGLQHHSGREISAIKLNPDDLLVLELHFPDLLQKLLIQEELTVNDIVILHEIGIKEDVLIHLIKYTSSNFMLTASDVVTLQLEGVPYSVINFMIES